MFTLRVPLLIFLLSLLVVISGLAYGENCVCSVVGSGPSFTVCPAVTVAGSNGQFQFNVISENPNTDYEILLNGQKVVSHGKLKKIKLEIPFDKPYSYLVVKSISPWESSSATILVLSSKLKKINTNKRVSISTIPQVFGYKLTKSGTLFTVLNAGFGRRSLEISLDGTTLKTITLSPISDSPEIFEMPFNTKNLTDGKHLFKAQLLLITGEKLIAITTIIKYFPPPVIQSPEVSPTTVPPRNITLTVLAVVKDKTGIKSVEINGISADHKNGKWVALIPVDFSKFKTSGATNVKFKIRAINNLNKSSETIFSTKVFVDVKPPSPSPIIPIWWLIGIFASIIVLLLFTILGY